VFVAVADIKDLELCLAEYQPAGFGGAFDEFIFSPRLDNLLSSYCSVEALRNYATKTEAVGGETNILVAALFDNEEGRCAFAACEPYVCCGLSVSC
jgi:aspartyl aminopeptidase